MAQIKNLIARWDAAWPSPMIISRQYDNYQFRIDLMNYPEPEVIVDEQTEQMEILSYYLIVWMKETEDGEYREMSPIQLPGPYWIVPNYYTQLVQDIRFQFCVQSDSTDYEAHSAIFTGRIVDSIEHDGTAIDVIPVEMFDAYKAYIQEIAMAAGAVVIDPNLDTAGAAADAKAVGDALSSTNERLGDLKEDLNIINPTADITWELGKSINNSGDVITNNYMALSNDIQCEPGDFFATTSPTVDVNNKFLVYYVIQYNGDTFISRTEFTSLIRSIVIGDNTTKIRVAFGRYGSSKTPISQQDIDDYVAVKFVRKAVSKADINMQLRNTVLNKYTDVGTDINTITENSFVFSPEGTANNPTTTGGYFIQTILYNATGTAAMQIAYKYDSGLCYYRQKVNGSWKIWRLNTAPANPTSPLYYAFGDSLTYGAVWTPKTESPFYQINQASYENQIPTRIANAIGAANSFSNKGVGGAYFVGTGSNKIINAIQSQDLSNAKIITIAGGRNDSENTLGDKTSASGDGTICGAIREILDYVTTNYKKLQIVWVGVTPNTRDNSTVFTRVFAGGWSLNSFDEKVSELCAEYSVPYVDWKKCTYMKHWADFSGAGNVYSHPNNEESYLQMGNYIAGQVAQYYRG